MASLSLQEIAYYPLKSARGLTVPSAIMSPQGFNFDRQWMVVSPDGTLYSQRSHPIMATIEIEVTSSECIINLPNCATLHLPLIPPLGVEKKVQLWGQTIMASHLHEKYDAALTEFLQTPAQLVYLPSSATRSVDPNFASGSTVGFADGFPFLIANSASLQELNSKLATPIPMNRFRANLIIHGAQPFAEDHWSRIQIGPAIFSLVKPCTRCTIITTDQHSGTKDPEPLVALKQFRHLQSPHINGVIFGENAMSEYSGTLEVGMPVTVLQTRL